MRIFDSLHAAIRTHATFGRIALYAIPSVGWSVNIRSIGPMSINLRRNRSYWLRRSSLS